MPTTSNGEGTPEINAQSKPPFLRRVRIRGYKSIAFCDVTLEPLTILVGRNAAGKSNFLDALAFLRDVLALGVTEAVKRRGGWAAIACRTSAVREIELEIETGFFCDRPVPQAGHNDPSDAYRPHLGGPVFSKYHLTLSVNTFWVPFISRESLEITDVSGKRIAGFVVSGGKIQSAESAESDWKAILQQAGQLLTAHEHPLLGVIGTPPVTELWAAVRHMAFYNFAPEAMRRVQPPSHGQMLDQSGWNLASVIASTRQSEEWAFNRVCSYLSTVVREVEWFEVVRYGEYETIRFRLRSGKTTLEFDAASMSDGTLRALAALTAVFQSVSPYGCPSVVGIEEPETALHPAAIRALVDALDDATQRTQILLTAHSAEMLDTPTIHPENLRVVEMIDGQTVIAPVDEASLEIVRRKLDTLGGLERQNQLGPDADDLERQERLSRTGSGAS